VKGATGLIKINTLFMNEGNIFKGCKNIELIQAYINGIRNGMLSDIEHLIIDRIIELEDSKQNCDYGEYDWQNVCSRIDELKNIKKEILSCINNSDK
jgi:hypothetical protein